MLPTPLSNLWTKTSNPWTSGLTAAIAFRMMPAMRMASFLPVLPLLLTACGGAKPPPPSQLGFDPGHGIQGILVIEGRESAFREHPDLMALVDAILSLRGVPAINEHVEEVERRLYLHRDPRLDDPALGEGFLPGPKAARDLTP